MFPLDYGFFRGRTVFPPRGEMLGGAGGRYEKNAFDKKIILTNIVARLRVTL